MDKENDLKDTLFCCYLPCKMFEVRNGGNIVETGMKHGMPVYECTVCRKKFKLSSVIRRENNLTGIIGSIVYSAVFIAGIIFLIRIPVIYKIALLTIPVTFLIIGMKKFVHVIRILSSYRNMRGGMAADDRLRELNSRLQQERMALQSRIP